MSKKKKPTPRIDAEKPDLDLARLDVELAKELPPGKATDERDQALGTLLAIHYQNPKTAFDGWCAMILSGRCGIPTPLWAIDILEKAALRSMAGLTDLDVALGFKGSGKGQTKKSDGQQRWQAILHDILCTRVRKLIHLGKSPTDACRMVASRLKKTPDWNPSAYALKAPNPETLLRIYRRWAKRNSPALTLIDEGFDSLVRTSKNEFISILS